MKQQGLYGAQHWGGW